MITATLDPNAVARGLLSASHAYDKDQAALCARLMLGAECILEQHALLAQCNSELAQCNARIKQLDDIIAGMPPQEPLPMFLQKQAE